MGAQIFCVDIMFQIEALARCIRSLRDLDIASVAMKICTIMDFVRWCVTQQCIRISRCRPLRIRMNTLRTWNCCSWLLTYCLLAGLSCTDRDEFRCGVKSRHSDSGRAEARARSALAKHAEWGAPTFRATPSEFWPTSKFLSFRLWHCLYPTTTPLHSLQTLVQAIATMSHRKFEAPRHGPFSPFALTPHFTNIWYRISGIFA